MFTSRSMSGQSGNAKIPSAAFLPHFVTLGLATA